MNYELAKKLKEAGLDVMKNNPVWDIDLYTSKPSEEDFKREWNKHSNYWKPTLEELIEACGDGFGKLVKEGNDFYAYDSQRIHSLEDKTPSEAVAKLWLELNKD